MTSEAPGLIDVRQIFAVLRRRYLYLVLSLVVALGVLAGALLLVTPLYQASTTLMVTSASGTTLNYDSLLFNRNLARTFIEVARSRRVATEALQRLGLTEAVERFQGRVVVTVVRDTEVLAIAVEDANPSRAAALANMLGTILQAEFTRYTSFDTLRVIDPATEPHTPIRPRPMLYTAIALLAGVTAGVTLALIADQFSQPRSTVALSVSAGTGRLEPDPESVDAEVF